MLNEDLLDKKDIEIFRLKKCIEDFKKYDSERKKYYSKALMELGQLKDYVAGLEDTGVDHNRVKIERLRVEVARFNSFFDPSMPIKTENLSIEEASLIIQKLKDRNLMLRKKVRAQKETIDSLINKINKE